MGPGSGARLPIVRFRNDETCIDRHAPWSTQSPERCTQHPNGSLFIGLHPPYYDAPSPTPVARYVSIMPTRPPKVGFVSLGCPKALVDSERILTQLRAEGYAVSPSYEDADLVVVNTCGFIDSAVTESLEAIGEALRENGKVIVTGCEDCAPWGAGASRLNGKPVRL